MRNHTPQALRSARALRREMSLPEVLLWRELRLRPMGVKYRRQHPLGPYVLDFYCAGARLAIEVDGMAHDMGDRPERDARRAAWLAGQGVTLLRIAAVDVLRDAASAAQAVARHCVAAPPPSALRAATSPVGGGSVEVC